MSEQEQRPHLRLESPAEVAARVHATQRGAERAAVPSLPYAVAALIADQAVAWELPDDDPLEWSPVAVEIVGRVLDEVAVALADTLTEAQRDRLARLRPVGR